LLAGSLQGLLLLPAPHTILRIVFVAIKTDAKYVIGDEMLKGL
jgi:hypothetical protein